LKVAEVKLMGYLLAPIKWHLRKARNIYTIWSNNSLSFDYAFNEKRKNDDFFRSEFEVTNYIH
jgi:hypothetical protein